jgi:GTPase
VVVVVLGHLQAGESTTTGGQATDETTMTREATEIGTHYLHNMLQVEMILAIDGAAEAEVLQTDEIIAYGFSFYGQSLSM